MYLTQGLHRSLQQNPSGIATVEAGLTRTFEEFTNRIARMAAGLLALGAAPGDRVGILAGNSVRYIEFVLACPWGGLVMAPMSTRWSQEEMRYQVEDCGLEILVVDDEHLEAARELRSACQGLRTLVHYGISAITDDEVDLESLVAGAEPVEDTRRQDDALVGILYTGGTTGLPKGVMISAGQLITSILGSLAASGQSNRPERFLHVPPFYHLASLGGIYGQVLLGSTHFVLPRFTPEGTAESVAHYRITGLTLVPTMIQRLVAHAEESGCDLSSLRHLGYGAEPISPSLLAKLGAMLPDLELCQRYGMTELGPVATVLRPEDHKDAARSPERLRSAGRAALHSELRTVDPEGKDTGIGVVGEIIVKSSSIMLGYWRRPEETAQAVRDGWMHTGDLGYLDSDGYLYVVDRLKDMIVTGGENVYSAEVEKVLSSHPDIQMCAVIGLPDPEWGERVHAVVVTTPGSDIDVATLRDFCGERIARYKAPRSVDVVDDLPCSGVGKILKREIRESYRARPSEGALP